MIHKPPGESMKDITQSTPIQSKKFIAAMVWNAGWLILLSLGIVYDESDSVLLSMIWVAGATQVTYIGGQAALDAFVRRASFQQASAIPQSQDRRTVEDSEV